jgi:hypothetical protein
MIFAYLMAGLFITWAAVLFLAAQVENYIEWLVKTMRKEGDI